MVNRKLTQWQLWRFLFLITSCRVRALSFFLTFFLNLVGYLHTHTHICHMISGFVFYSISCLSSRTFCLSACLSQVPTPRWPLALSLPPSASHNKPLTLVGERLLRPGDKTPVSPASTAWVWSLGAKMVEVRPDSESCSLTYTHTQTHVHIVVCTYTWAYMKN